MSNVNVTSSSAVSWSRSVCRVSATARLRTSSYLRRSWVASMHVSSIYNDNNNDGINNIT